MSFNKVNASIISNIIFKHSSSVRERVSHVSCLHIEKMNNQYVFVVLLFGLSVCSSLHGKKNIVWPSKGLPVHWLELPMHSLSAQEPHKTRVILVYFFKA